VIPKGWTRAHSGNARNPWNWLDDNYPSVAGHLAPFSDAAQKRYDKGDYWWELRACDYYDVFEKPKIVWPEIAMESRATLDHDGLYFPTTAFICATGDRYLLGLLNSRLLWFYLGGLCSVLGDARKRGRLRLKRQYLMKVPIAPADLGKRQSKSRHDTMVTLVQRMLDLNKRLQGANTDHERTLLQRQIDATDAEIDRLVYELYDLTEEEIAIVEEAAK